MRIAAVIDQLGNKNIGQVGHKRLKIGNPMTEGNFVDYVKVFLTSGKGGKRALCICTVKNLLPKEGQMGGDGGRGGHII